MIRAVGEDALGGDLCFGCCCDMEAAGVALICTGLVCDPLVLLSAVQMMEQM